MPPATPTPHGDARTDPIARLVAVIDNPLPITEFASLIAHLETEHGPGLTIRNGDPSGFEVRTPGRICDCLTCEEADSTFIAQTTCRLVARRFTACPECGNKRCPKTTHHDLPCGNSNEPGQHGSIYSPAPAGPHADGTHG